MLTFILRKKNKEEKKNEITFFFPELIYFGHFLTPRTSLGANPKLALACPERSRRIGFEPVAAKPQAKPDWLCF